METTAAPSNNTELDNRTLWYDGDSTVSPDTVLNMVMSGQPIDHVFVTHLTKDIEQYNKFVAADDKITVKNKVKPLSFDWVFPAEYKELDVKQHVVAKLAEHAEDPQNSQWTQDEQMIRVNRTLDEYKLYETLGVLDVLRVLIYIINTLQSNSVVWGVGRGSAVSSYILYLIGVHDVDSVKYDLDVTDFLRT